MKSPRATCLHAFALILTIAILATAPAVASDSDWPHFRGPDQNGATESGALASDSFGLEIDWKRSLGSGYSSISVVADRGVTMFTDGEKDYVVAFSLESGQELWRYPLAEMYAGHGGSADGPISTPTIRDGVVYALGPRGQLVALQLESGEQLWRIELDGETSSSEPIWGYSTTPVVVGERVILLTGGQNGRSITAFDARTGEIAWHVGDDRVGYQSPLVAELAGRRQLIAATDHDLSGLDPQTGRVLWSHRHTERDEEGFGQPVLLPGGRILLNFWEEAALFRVGEAGGEYSVEELWRSRNLKRTYALPVYHAGYIYGFNSRFLSCIDPETGEAVWRSRPPGGDGLILVNGKLIITAAEGDLVVADADPAGYRELARLPLFDAEGLTSPSLAGDSIYARNGSDLARVRITDRRTTQMTEAPVREMEIPVGELGDLVRAVMVASGADKQDLIEAYLARQTSFPIVEGDLDGESQRVHFVYYGDVEDVALHGTMLDPSLEEVPLFRVGDTHLYYYSMELDPEGHWEYRYSVDYGDMAPDPRNPYEIGSLNGPSSELRMPRWPVPAHLAEPRGLRGRIESFIFESAIRENEREVQVYLPAGYDFEENRDRRYPLVLMNNGDSALSNARIDRSFDNLMGSSVEPVIVALLPRVGAEFGGDTSDDYVRVLTEELIPRLDRAYRTQTDPSSRAITGVGSGGYISAYAAFRAPGTFGKVATQSLYVNPATREAFFDAIESGVHQDLDILIEWSRHDYQIPAAGIDAAADSRDLAERLERRGVEVERSEVTGAAGWGAWRATIDGILEHFYPL